MSGRRGFLAFLGGASVTGIATTRASATAPTLILPPDLVPAAVVSDAGGFVSVQLDASHVNDFLTVARLAPASAFEGWLRGGMQVAWLYNGRSEAVVEHELRASLRVQAEAQMRETPEEAHARVVQIVDRAAARWNRPGGVR